MGRFEGQTATITGAGGGIGRACAQLLAEKGAGAALPGTERLRRHADELAPRQRT